MKLQHNKEWNKMKVIDDQLVQTNIHYQNETLKK